MLKVISLSSLSLSRALSLPVSLPDLVSVAAFHALLAVLLHALDHHLDLFAV